jgi:hypothetical protein
MTKEQVAPVPAVSDLAKLTNSQTSDLLNLMPVSTPWDSGNELVADQITTRAFSGCPAITG